MKRDPILAFLMLTAVSASFAWYSRDDAFGFAIAAAGAAAVFGGLRFDAVRRRMPYIAGGLGGLFLLYGLWGPSQVQVGEALLAYRVTHTAAMFCMAVMGAFLFARWERMPPMYVLAALLALAFMGDFRILERHAGPYQATAAFLLVCAAASAAPAAGRTKPKKGGGRGLRWGVTAFAAALGIGGGSAVFAYQQELERLLSDLAPEVARQSTGFADQSQLNSVQRMRRLGDEDVMLRVTGAEDIEYFAGKVFEHYQAEEWYASTSADTLEQADPPPWMDLSERFQSRTVFRLSGVPDEPLSTVVITPDWSLEDALFRPLGAAYIRTMGWTMEVDANDSGNFIRSYPGEPYLIYAGRSTPPPVDPERLLSTPRELDQEMPAIADRIVEGAQTDGERVERVVAFLRENYRYAGWVNAPRESEPLLYFLLDQRSGSCEYFASAAAMLLRYAGVPCRYVTGFLVAETQSYGGYRLARSRDAHAWVEAYIEGEGWRIVDATPEEGRPDYRESSYAVYVVDAFRQMRREIGALFSARGAQDVWVWLQRHGARLIGLIASLWPLWLGAAAIVAALATGGRLLRVRRRFGRKRTGFADHPLTPVLAEGERRTARGGYARRGNETLHAFAERLAAAPQGEDWAAWFRKAGEARYGFGADDGRLADWTAELRRTLPQRPPRRPKKE